MYNDYKYKIISLGALNDTNTYKIQLEPGQMEEYKKDMIKFNEELEKYNESLSHNTPVDAYTEHDHGDNIKDSPLYPYVPRIPTNKPKIVCESELSELVKI